MFDEEEKIQALQAKKAELASAILDEAVAASLDRMGRADLVAEVRRLLQPAGVRRRMRATSSATLPLPTTATRSTEKSKAAFR